jgi:hypothetical protein
MSGFFETLILGHLIGDYLLQNKWMAMNKHHSSFKCAVHCLLYTLAVVVTTAPVASHTNLIYWGGFIFLTHYPIDRYSLADKWLKLINGRSMEEFVVNGHSDIPPEHHQSNYHILRGGFTAVVYAATDNTMHLALAYYGGIYLFGL